MPRARIQPHLARSGAVSAGGVRMLFETLAIGCPPTASVLPVFWTLPNVVALTWIKVGHAPGRRSFDLDQSSSLPPDAAPTVDPYQHQLSFAAPNMFGRA